MRNSLTHVLFQQKGFWALPCRVRVVRVGAELVTTFFDSLAAGDFKDTRSPWTETCENHVRDLRILFHLALGPKHVSFFV